MPSLRAARQTKFRFSSYMDSKLGIAGQDTSDCGLAVVVGVLRREKRLMHLHSAWLAENP